MTSITEKHLRQIVDFDEDRMLIRRALTEALESKDPERLVLFCALHLVEWILRRRRCDAGR